MKTWYWRMDITWIKPVSSPCLKNIKTRFFYGRAGSGNPSGAPQLITSHNDTLYRELTADDSFFKNFFKTLKNGAKDGTIARTFITGVLPITIDDLSSGFNIADFITLKEKFETMMGFTRQETDKLIDEIYRDLCRQHLSRYFTWALESSYASGRTDLEFIGKYHTQFGGLRFLLEFKYYSNARLNKISPGPPVSGKISQFQPPAKDIEQLKGYGAEWKKQHPGPGNKSFLVYCFGNQGFRVFPQN